MTVLFPLSRGAGKCGEDRGLRLRRGAKPPFSFSTEKEKAPFDGVKRKRLGGGIPDFVRNARSALYGGLARWCPVGFCPLNRIWQSKKLGVFPDTLSFSFAAAPWLLGADGHPSPTAVRVAHSEAECAGVGGQALQFSTQRQPPQFCELRRSSPDNSQCTPHSAGDRQVWSEPIRKTPAFPPTGPQGQLCGQRLFSYTIKRRILFSAQPKREWGFCPAAEPQASGLRRTIPAPRDGAHIPTPAGGDPPQTRPFYGQNATARMGAPSESR